MSIRNKLKNFNSLDYKDQLSNWRELLSMANDFINSEKKETELAKELAETIYYHRSLMGSSKAYEGATDIDVDLCEVSLAIARLAYGNSNKLKDYLEAALYYSNFRPNRFNKVELEKEISELVK